MPAKLTSKFLSGGHFNPAVSIGLWEVGRFAASGRCWLQAHVVSPVASNQPALRLGAPIPASNAPG